jgi:uncharacterized protein (TIGR03083 family)
MVSETVLPSFRTAGEWFAEFAGRDEVVQRWAEPSALTGYSIGGLVGHVAAAVGWLGPLLETTDPGGEVPVWSVADYLAPFPVHSQADLEGPLHTAARAQGERSAQRGPKETLTRFVERFDTVVTRLAGDNLDRTVDLRPTLPAAIRLGDFLRTRVVELVVHGDDLAASIGVTAEPPADAMAVATEALVAVAVSTHGPIAVLRALARRERSTDSVFPVL